MQKLKIITLLVIAVAATQAHAAGAKKRDRKLARAWQIPANQSYLNVFEAKDQTNESLKLLSTQEAGEVRREYILMTREHETRQHHNLNRSVDDSSYFDRLKTFSTSIVRKMVRATLSRQVQKAEKNSATVQAARQVQNVVQGTTEVAVQDNFKMGTSADIVEKKGQLWMQSSMLDSAIDVNLAQPNEVNLFSAAGERFDRYRFSVGRALPIFDLRSGLSYGVQTTRMTASVSRALTEIAPSLSAEYSRTHGLDANKSGYAQGRGEDAVKLSYGINF